MESDSESRSEPTPGRDLWELPRIVAVSIDRMRYRPPRKHVVQGRIVDFEEGVEILVETDEAIPMRALTPALHVGSTEITENERISPSLHRFFVLDENGMSAGDPITLGWVGYPDRDAESRFRYEPPTAVTSELD